MHIHTHAHTLKYIEGLQHYGNKSFVSRFLSFLGLLSLSFLSLFLPNTNFSLNMHAHTQFLFLGIKGSH